MTDRPDQTLWYTRCPVPSSLGLAARLGWLDETFAAEGFGISAIVDSPDGAVRESHFDHHLAWSFRQGGNISAIWARSNGQRTRLVGLTWTDELQAVITLPATGIRRARDLVGRRFGIPRRLHDSIDFHRATALEGMASAYCYVEWVWDEVRPTSAGRRPDPGRRPRSAACPRSPRSGSPPTARRHGRD